MRTSDCACLRDRKFTGLDVFMMLQLFKLLLKLFMLLFLMLSFFYSCSRTSDDDGVHGYISDDGHDDEDGGDDDGGDEDGGDRDGGDDKSMKMI